MKRIDHAEASSHFIAETENEAFHDKRLWDLRMKRDGQRDDVPEWSELRDLASAIKEHTLTHLSDYLLQFEENAKKNGAHVHWALDAEEHNRIVHEILVDHKAKTLVKSKSMLTDECELRPYLARRGVDVIETDLGERIQQLDDEPPSHIVVPAVHKLRGDVAKVFARTLDSDPANDDPHYLSEHARMTTRPGHQRHHPRGLEQKGGKPMIARLRGKLLERDPGGLVIDVGGVGYHVLVPISILERLDSDEVDLHIHTEVREDAILLFGFLSKREREVFRRLLSVQGIGPMTALAVLSGLSLEDLLTAVRSRDHKRLQGIPKIGKRTAERICLELGEQFADMAMPEPASPGGELRDALTALEHLGYKTAAANTALNRAKKEAPEGPLETWIRLALKELSPSGR